MPHPRSLLSLLDLQRIDLERLWLASAGWKDQRSRRRSRFADRRVATIFDGPAFRTRLAFDSAIDAVGAHRVDLPVVLGEPVQDRGQPLGRQRRCLAGFGLATRRGLGVVVGEVDEVAAFDTLLDGLHRRPCRGTRGSHVTRPQEDRTFERSEPGPEVAEVVLAGELTGFGHVSER